MTCMINTKLPRSVRENLKILLKLEFVQITAVLYYEYKVQLGFINMY